MPRPRRIDGLLSIGDVAEIVGKYPGTLALWDKWSDEEAKAGRPRLIPASVRVGAAGVRYWTQEGVEGIKEFIKNHKPGDLTRFSRKKYKSDTRRRKR